MGTGDARPQMEDVKVVWKYMRLYTEQGNNRDKVRIYAVELDANPSETYRRLSPESESASIVEVYSKIAELGTKGWELLLQAQDGSYLFKKQAGDV